MLTLQRTDGDKEGRSGGPRGMSALGAPSLSPGGKRLCRALNMGQPRSSLA